MPSDSEPPRAVGAAPSLSRRVVVLGVPLGILGLAPGVAASAGLSAGTSAAVGDRMQLIGAAAADSWTQAGALAAGLRVPTASSRDLEQAVVRSMGGRSSVIGVSVLDRHTGARWDYRGTALMRTGSVVKVLIVAEALRQARAQGSALATSPREQARLAITRSDNASANALYSRIGGHAAVARLAGRLGMGATAAATPAAHWGHTLTSANDLVTMMAAIAGNTTAVDEEDREYLLGLMGKVMSGQRWGVGTVRSSSVAVRLKNGWMAVDRPWVINSVGDVRGKGRNYVLAIMQRAQPTESSGITRASRVGRAVFSELDDPLT